MAENGEEKLIAVARHIAKALGHSDTRTDDILQIFSSLDDRLRRKLTDDDGGDGGDGDHHQHSFEHTFKFLHRQISPYLSSDHSVFSGSTDTVTFLQYVDQLISAVRNADAKHVSASYLNRAEDLLQQAMFRLEDEFKTLIERAAESFDLSTASVKAGDNVNDDDDDNSGLEEEDDEEIPVAHPIVDYDIIIDALPAGTIKELHDIAKRMVAAGFGKECAHAYSTCRRYFLEESLSRLGLEKQLSIDDVHKMHWTELEDEIEKWIKAVHVTLRILYPSERRLCDRVFFGFSSAADLSFMEVCRGSAIQLLNFADAIAIGSRAPERLFKVLDVYEALRDLMPEFDLIFSDEYCVFLRNEAITIWKRLGEGIRGIFMELENLIRRDPAKTAVPGGGLHPITRYVMNYLRAASRSRLTLEQVFEESGGGGDYRKGGDERALLSSSALAVEMAWIMELLESNLEAKSKIYKDSALCSVFMMNNGRYIVQKVRDGELGSLLGDDWIRKHAAKVRQYHSNYQRSSWGKVLGVLKIDNNSMSPNEGASMSLKEKLKLFNSYFDEICKTQSTWVVFDEQLREDLKISVSANLTSAYRNFIGRLLSNPDFVKHVERDIMYSVEELEARINELFQGNGAKKGR